MSANIIYGKPIAEKLSSELKQEFSKFSNLQIAIIQVGDDLGSNKYIQLKTQKANEFGIVIDHIKYDELVNESTIVEKILELNSDPNISGIMIQSPIKNLDLAELANLISPGKDFDGMGENAIVLPAVDSAILKILEETGENDLKNKHICIVNDSIILGKPLAKYFTNLGLKVDVCNKYTPDISVFTCVADILISGTGIAGLIKSETVKENSIVIDCGFPKGDFDFESLSQKVKAITPVPGGVGPLTVVCLFANLLTLLKK